VPALLAFALLALASFARPVQAAPTGFAVDPTSLYSVDFGTASATLIGVLGTRDAPLALAISSTGELYATDSSGNFYSVNPLTGAATFVADTGRGNIEALDFNGSTLLGVDFSGTPTVFSINLLTGATTNVVTATSFTGVARAAALLDSNTLLLRTDGPTDETLRTLNLTTGATSVIGTINSTTIVAGLDFFSDGNLYGLNIAGNFLRIDPATASTTLLGDTNQFWLGLAAVGPAAPGGVIPEPGTLALVATGLLPLAGAVVRKRRRSV